MIEGMLEKSGERVVSISILRAYILNYLSFITKTFIKYSIYIIFFKILNHILFRCISTGTYIRRINYVQLVYEQNHHQR